MTRNTRIDFIKGVCILMVVAIHTISEFSSVGGVLLRNILNCAVPIFLALSAYLTSNKDSYKLDGYLVKRINRLYIPVLFWSLPFLLLALSSGKGAVYSFLNYLVCGFGVYYFIALLLQYTLLIKLMYWFSYKRSRLVLACIISALSIILVSYILHFTEFEPSLIVYAGLFPLWMSFFVFGLYLKNNNLISLRLSLYFSVLFLVLSVMESYFYSLGHTNLRGLGIKLSSFIFSFMVIQWIMYWIKSYSIDNRSSLYQIFVTLGRMSFGIYLIHIQVLTVLNKLVDLHPTLLFITTVLISSFIIIMCRFLFPKKYLNLLGF